jgi:hypothetical protein
VRTQRPILSRELTRPLDRTLSHAWMTAVLFKIARLLHPPSLSTQSRFFRPQLLAIIIRHVDPEA